jgi:hypothetical protein
MLLPMHCLQLMGHTEKPQPELRCSTKMSIMASSGRSYATKSSWPQLPHPALHGLGLQQMPLLHYNHSTCSAKPLLLIPLCVLRPPWFCIAQSQVQTFIHAALVLLGSLAGNQHIINIGLDTLHSHPEFILFSWHGTMPAKKNELGDCSRVCNP